MARVPKSSVTSNEPLTTPKIANASKYEKCNFRFDHNHKKVLFTGFHLNGHTLGFHLAQTQKIEPPSTA